MTLDELRASAKVGRATLINGHTVVEFAAVTEDSIIQLQRGTAVGTVGLLSYAIDPGVGFSIMSASSSDCSTVDWLILTP